MYDFTVHNRADKTLTVTPARVLIVEGILIFANRELRELMDIKIFVDTDADVRLLRGQLLENAGTPAAFIEIHDQVGAADFHASSVGNESTGHVSAAALGQALGPALVFELCRVL